MNLKKKKKTFIQEFKAFAIKGNAVDLAIGVVIGAAFGKIVNSLVGDLIMPIMNYITGGVKFSQYSIVLREQTEASQAIVLSYGNFIQNIFDFFVIALSIFLVIRYMNKLYKAEEEKPEKEKVVTPPEDITLLREIRDSLQKK